MDDDRGRLVDEAKRRLQRAARTANTAGALDLFVFALLLFPVHQPVDRTKVIIINTIAFVVLLVGTYWLGDKLGARNTERTRSWLAAGRDPTPEERDYALRLPLIQARLSASLWLFAAVAFTLLNVVIAPEAFWVIPIVIVLGGITTSVLYYLLAERILRPIAVCALRGGLPEQPARPGVRGKLTLVWLGATGGPLIGIAATAISGGLSEGVSRERFAVSVLFLAAITAAAGYVATINSAASLAEPLANVRAALEQVEQGRLDVEVEVDDGSELGLVEAGVNRMAAGLREREKLRDLFGRHVGREVARAALDGGVKLGGEVREVGVLFVDLLGSTALADRLPPERVVSLLNEFFALVVAVTEAHGGSVNKFEGDGALCVFGAPASMDDPAGAALAAAREMRARLLDELPQVDAAVGISAGPAVAGNVGAEARFEYTVIGDPVNEASRLCDLAKSRPERVIAADAAVERADPRESARWAFGEATVLRGREAPTRIATATS
jgi:adenylate cyclase